jgi:hypothetical protein
MPKPTRAEVEAALSSLPAEQHPTFLAEVERRLNAPDESMAQPAGAQDVAPERRAGFERALAGAETIGSAPWYTQGLGPIPSVTEALSALPSVGGFVGGLLGGGGGTLAAPGPGSLVGAVKGAAIGGAGGEAFRQLGFRAIGGDSGANSPLEAARGIAVEAGKQGASELLGQGISRGATKLAAPFAANADIPLIGAAERSMVEMPASALSTSKAVPYAEAVAATGFGGDMAAKRYANAVGQLTAVADHTVARASKLTDDVARGEAIWRGFKDFKNKWVQAKNYLYKQVNDEMPNGSFKAQETANFLEQLVAQKRAASNVIPAGTVEDKAFYESMLKLLTKKERGVTRLKSLSIADVHQGLQALEHKIETAYADPVAQANKATLLRLQATLEGEYMTMLERVAPEAAQRLKVANKVYAEGVSKLNSTFGESIHKLAQDGKYDLIAKAVTSPRMSVADVPRIFEVVGDDGADAIRASLAADLVAKAKGTGGADAVLTHQGLGRAMRTYEKSRPGLLEAIFKPEQYQTLTDVANLSGSLERGTKVMSGSPTAGKARMMGYASLGTTAALGHPQALALIIGDVSFNRFIASKAGQRWLTTGYQLAPGITATLRQAPRAGVSAYDVNRQRERDRAAQER